MLLVSLGLCTGCHYPPKGEGWWSSVSGKDNLDLETSATCMVTTVVQAWIFPDPNCMIHQVFDLSQSFVSTLTWILGGLYSDVCLSAQVTARQSRPQETGWACISLLSFPAVPLSRPVRLVGMPFTRPSWPLLLAPPL